MNRSSNIFSYALEQTLSIEKKQVLETNASKPIYCITNKQELRKVIPFLLNAFITGSDRITPVATKCSAGNPNAGRGLPAFIFVPIDQADGSNNIFIPEAGGDDLIEGLVLLDITFQYRIQYLVRRQGVCINLIGR